MQLEPNGGPKVVDAELKAAMGNAFTFCREEVQVGDPCALDRCGLGGDAQVVKATPLLAPLVDQRHRVGQDNACLLLEDPDGCSPRVGIQLAAGVLKEPVKAVRVDQQHGQEDVGLDCDPNAAPIIRGAGHLGHDMPQGRSG